MDAICVIGGRVLYKSCNVSFRVLPFNCRYCTEGFWSVLYRSCTDGFWSFLYRSCIGGMGSFLYRCCNGSFWCFESITLYVKKKIFRWIFLSISENLIFYQMRSSLLCMRLFCKKHIIAFLWYDVMIRLCLKCSKFMFKNHIVLIIKSN